MNFLIMGHIQHYQEIMIQLDFIWNQLKHLLENIH